MNSTLLWSLGLLSLLPVDLCPTHVERGAVVFDGVDDLLVGAPLKLLDSQRRTIIAVYSVGAVTGVHYLYSQYDGETKAGFAATFSAADGGLALTVPKDGDAPVDRLVFPLPTPGAEVFECHVYDLGQTNQNHRLRIYRAEGSAEATVALVGGKKGVLGTRVRATDKPFSVGGRADGTAHFAGRVMDLRVIDGLVTPAECDEALALWRSAVSPRYFSRVGSVRYHWTFGDLGGDSTDVGWGLIHDAVGANHLRPVGTATSALVLEAP